MSTISVEEVKAFTLDVLEDHAYKKAEVIK